jgi:signal transduction histidine kinase
LSNAIKYSPAGGKITFDLKLEKPANDKPKVRVSIIDQGPGIKHQDLKILGQDFQQGSDSDPQKSLGTGLGLSLVANLAEKQGGQLELHPAPGRGTIASIVFPAAAA